MDNMDKQQEKPLSFNDFLRGMTPSAFQALGVDQLAYIKASNDNQDFTLYAADGTVLAKFETFDHAMSATEDIDLKAVTVH